MIQCVEPCNPLDTMDNLSCVFSSSCAFLQVIPTDDIALSQKIQIYDFEMYRDRACTKYVTPRENLTYFLTPGFNYTISNISHIWDFSRLTSWKPPWSQLDLTGVKFYAGVVSATSAIDWSCIRIKYSGNRNWEALTWYIEAWDGAGYISLAKLRSL